MKRPEFESKALPRTPLTGLAWQELGPFAVHSLYEPLMGSGSSLYEFKRLGLRVFGSEWLEAAYLGSKALNENNSTRLSADEIARFSPGRDPRLAAYPRFALWVERGFFDEEQAAWLGYWRDQLDGLSAASAGLVVVAVQWVINNWLDRAEGGQKALPGGLAISVYMKRVNQWIWDNGQANRTMLGDSVALAQEIQADACYVYLPPHRVAIDMRDWLLEAWWQGTAVPDLKAFYDDNPFYGTVDEYRQAVTRLFDHLEQIPLWVVQYRSDDLESLWDEQPAWLNRPHREILPPTSLPTDGAGERLLLAKRKSS